MDEENSVHPDARAACLPFGNWPSPISAASIVESGVRLFQPQLDRGRAYWLETRPREEGRTVLFSSHLLDEVEQVADHVTMISRGRIAQSAFLQPMREAHRCVTVRFEESRDRPPAVEGVLRWDGRDREWTAVVYNDSGSFESRLRSFW